MGDYTERPDPSEYAEFYGGYVARVGEGGIVARLATQLEDTVAVVRAAPDPDYAYAPGKWSIKEVLGHLADAERVLSYRALRFARADATALAGFDENAYVPPGRFGERTLESLVAELRAARAATVALFGGLPAGAWTRTGTANTHLVSVRALAWIIAGHELNHRAVLQERYLTSVAASG